MNKSMIDFARKEIKKGLLQLPIKNKDFFKRAYSHNNTRKDIFLIVDELSEERLSMLLTQVQNTLKKKQKEGGKVNVWVVGVSDCESNSIVAICSTKKIAERELFKERDRLVAKWNRMSKEYVFADDKKMIDALSGNDYEKWDNYSHDRPYLYEAEIIDK